jgi:hypothetical protein
MVRASCGGKFTSGDSCCLIGHIRGRIRITRKKIHKYENISKN